MEEFLITWTCNTWLIMGLVTALAYLCYQIHHNGSCIKDELILGAGTYFMMVVGGYFVAVFVLPLIFLGLSFPTAQYRREIVFINRFVESSGLPREQAMNHLRGTSGENIENWNRRIACPSREPVRIFDAAASKTIDVLESGVDTVKTKSKFAIACGAIITFLLAPINFVRGQTKQENQPQIHGAVIMDIEPEMNIGFVKIRVTGQNTHSSYLVEADWATAKFSRGFITWRLSPKIKVKVGQDFAPWAFTLPLPPSRPVCTPLISIKEFPVVSPGIYLGIDNNKLVNAEIQLTENDKGSKRLMSRVTKRICNCSYISLVCDLTDQETKWLASLMVKKKTINARIGYLQSKTGITRYLHLAFQPRKEIELAVQYEDSPWIENRNRWTTGINLLWEKARLRLSWISDSTPLAQLSYTF